MRIAFLYIAEAYQCYHAAAVALELDAMDTVEVDIFYNDPETPHHLDRISRAYGVAPLHATRLKRNLWARLIQKLRIFGLAKEAVMHANRAELMGYDVVVAVEKTVSYLIGSDPDRPTFVYIPHGSGDREVAIQPTIAAFDLVLPSGRKTAERFLANGLIRPGSYATPGYIKLETAERIRRAGPPLFENELPIVLYNAHKARGLQSWRLFIEPMLNQFEQQSEYNLIVAPHVKMFRRKSGAVRERWRNRSRHNIIVDPGSDRSVDNSYTVSADIYIGDVSSQVYEFLIEPRPCIFLNAHRINWRDNPSFRHWHLGEVIEDPSDLPLAIGRAYDLHPRFLPLQRQLAQETLGDLRPGAATRAAQAIFNYAHRGCITA